MTKELWAIRFCDDGSLYKAFESKQEAEGVRENLIENHAFRAGIGLIVEGPYLIALEIKP